MPSVIPANFAAVLPALLSICHGASRVYVPDPTNHPTVLSVGVNRPLMMRANQLLARELCARLATTSRNYSRFSEGPFPDLKSGAPGGPQRARLYFEAANGYRGCSTPQTPGPESDYSQALGAVLGDAAQLFSDFHASAAADAALDPDLADEARRQSSHYGAIP